MLTVGIHIGSLAVRVSQAYKSPSDCRVRFDSVEFPTHTDTEWSAYYGDDVLPNAYHPSSGKVGYEALDEVGPAKVPRMDTALFHQLLDNREPARTVWARFLRTLWRSPALQIRDEATVTLTLEGVDLSSTNRWRPWVRGEDRTSDLERQLCSLGQVVRPARYRIARDRVIAQSCVSSQQNFQQGDLVALGGAFTRIWQITGSSSKSIRSSPPIPGITDFVSFLKKKDRLSDGTWRELLILLRGGGHEDNVRRRLEEWQAKRLFPAIRAELDALLVVGVRPTRQFWIGGEGAYLLTGLRDHIQDTSMDIEWTSVSQHLQAQGAAFEAYQYHHQSAEE